MSFFKSLFGKKNTSVVAEKIKVSKTPEILKIQEIERLTSNSVKVIFEVPLLAKEKYDFIPGQYIDLDVTLNGETVRRSYSICSDVNEPLAIGVKKIEDGYVSAYFNDEAKKGHKIKVSTPLGGFKLSEKSGKFVGIVAGSGITPLLSMAKYVQRTEGTEMTLIVGNRNDQSVMFANELEALAPERVKVIHVFSQQEKEGHRSGRLTEEKISSILDEELVVSEIDGFYLCGPEEVIMNSKKVLERLGISSDKIHFELFSTPTEMTSEPVQTSGDVFEGIAQVKVILDGENEEFELATDGDTILEEVESYGVDAPYSCRGGICRSCKAKVLEGSARMDMNFTLSPEEVKDGYILTCQAHPTSEKLIVSYDE